MKKGLLLTLICFLLLGFTACSDQAKQNSSVSVTLPKEVIQKVADEAAREGAALSDDSLCDIICLIYVDGWAEAYSYWDAYWEYTDKNGQKQRVLHNDYRNHFLIEKNIPLSKIDDVVLTHPDVYVGAKVQAEVIVSCGNVSYSGKSIEVELTEEGADLEVILKKDKRGIVIGQSQDDILEIEEIPLESPQNAVDDAGNEYWLFTIPEKAKAYKINWYLDNDQVAGNSDSLKLYKALVSKGDHTISYAGKDGNKRAAGEITINVDKEQKRIVVISTEKGLEFCINRFDTDVRFNDLCVRDLATGIEISCEKPREADGNYTSWQGIWPFVEPGKEYTLDLHGHWGAPTDAAHNTINDDHWKSELVAVTYTGSRDTPLSQKDLDYISTITNYVKNNQYSAKEVNIAAQGKAPEIRLITDFVPTKENEIFNVFADAGKVSGIYAEWQFIYQKKNDDGNGSHEEWLFNPRITMYEAGERRLKFENFDLVARENDDRIAEFQRDWDAMEAIPAGERPNDYYGLELRMKFLFKLQGLNNQGIWIEGYDSSDWRQRATMYAKVKRYNESN